MNKASINLKVDQDFKDRLDKLSASSYRSITALIIMALEKTFPELKDPKDK